MGTTIFRICSFKEFIAVKWHLACCKTCRGCFTLMVKGIKVTDVEMFEK